MPGCGPGQAKSFAQAMFAKESFTAYGGLRLSHMPLRLPGLLWRWSSAVEACR